MGFIALEVFPVVLTPQPIASYPASMSCLIELMSRVGDKCKLTILVGAERSGDGIVIRQSPGPLNFGRIKSLSTTVSARILTARC